MNRRTVKKHFTLVELLVAMAIFSILLLVSMQIFSSSRRLWLDSENKNKIYADARTAMEFITSRIQTQVYTENMPFLIEKNSRNSKMFFPTAMPMNRKDADGNERDKLSIRFIGFSRSEDGILRMHIYSDEGKVRSFQENIPPFIRTPENGKTPYEKACETVQANTVDKDNYSGKEYNCIELMENVVAFDLHPKYRYGYMMGVAPQGAVYNENSKTSPPYILEIVLGVMDSKENFKKWKNGELTDDEHTYYFRRSILLNYRGAR
ncbi:MAG: prepilin-type N-terminal cleavage/methylation domain-containing protein [Lentisphaerae bacterium]|nr:prepilin-type N-terminal cleavage/methylation domain-containing protein [Lentisphaerota bacterium]